MPHDLWPFLFSRRFRWPELENVFQALCPLLPAPIYREWILFSNIIYLYALWHISGGYVTASVPEWQKYIFIAWLIALLTFCCGRIVVHISWISHLRRVYK